MKRTDLAALADQLAATLDAIAAGDLDASAAMRYRLEGAVVALRVTLGEQGPDALADLVRPPS